MKRPHARKRKVRERRKSAERLLAERELRSDTDQVKLLDKRLGKGLGAVKERAKLREKIDASNKT